MAGPFEFEFRRSHWLRAVSELSVELFVGWDRLKAVTGSEDKVKRFANGLYSAV